MKKIAFMAIAISAVLFTGCAGVNSRSAVQFNDIPEYTAEELRGSTRATSSDSQIGNESELEKEIPPATTSALPKQNKPDFGKLLGLPDKVTSKNDSPQEGHATAEPVTNKTVQAPARGSLEQEVVQLKKRLNAVENNQRIDRGRLASVEDKVTFIDKNVISLQIDFERGNSKLSKAAALKLDEFVASYGKSITSVTVKGHSSTDGPVKKNTELSQQRAESVAEYLKKNGIYTTVVPGDATNRYGVNTNVVVIGRTNQP